MEAGSGVSATTRRRILEAVCAVLAVVGHEGITTRRIAREAGVNVATLHYHFGTKKALIAAATRHALLQAEAVIREGIQKAASPVEALAIGFETIGRLAREMPGVLRYDLVLRAFRDESARQEAIGMYATYRHLVEQIIQWHLAEGGRLAPGITPQMVGHYVVAAVDGVLLQRLVVGDDESARNSLIMVRRHVLSLLGRGDGEGDAAP